MLQNATPLRKSAPWPPNSSDENVSCTASATENASLQILFKCPTPAIVFGNATKPSRLAHFWEGAQSLAPATRNVNVQKWSVRGVFCTFWLRNVLRATTACSYLTSQLLKVFRSWGVLYILTWKCASRHNDVHFFISHLARWLRTRRFSKPTFRPSGATNHWNSLEKHNVSRLSYLFAHLHLLSFDFLFSDLLSSIFSSLWPFPSLLLICPYCRKFDF